jgi:hypothetical protein
VEIGVFRCVCARACVLACVPATTTTCDHDSALFFSIGTRVTLSKEITASIFSFESALKTAVTVCRNIRPYNYVA